MKDEKFNNMDNLSTYMDPTCFMFAPPECHLKVLSPKKNKEFFHRLEDSEEKYSYR